jgi:hypothetical protein
MKNRVLLLGWVALVALGTTGCFLTSAQVLVHYALPTPLTIETTSSVVRVPVDLNTVAEYTKHKSQLKTINDLALVGQLTTLAGPGGDLEVYITASETDYTMDEVCTKAVRLWGGGGIGHVGAAPATRKIGWDESAGYVSSDGRAMLLQEAKGDGKFTLYVVHPVGADSQIRVDGAMLILVLGAGV